MKILDSPASTILVTNSEGARYDIQNDPSGCSRYRRRVAPWERLRLRRTSHCVRSADRTSVRLKAWEGITTTAPSNWRSALKSPSQTFSLNQIGRAHV